MKNDIIFIYTTYPDLSTAKMVAQTLLEKKLIACANILPSMISMYWWQNKIEEANEVVAILKTQKHLFESCQREISNCHPYSVPCILQIDITKGNDSYVQWLNANLV